MPTGKHSKQSQRRKYSARWRRRTHIDTITITQNHTHTHIDTITTTQNHSITHTHTHTHTSHNTLITENGLKNSLHLCREHSSSVSPKAIMVVTALAVAVVVDALLA